jgi:hypothetical protein
MRFIECSCPECAYRYEIAKDLAGKTVLCPECQTRFKAVNRAVLPVAAAKGIPWWKDKWLRLPIWGWGAVVAGVLLLFLAIILTIVESAAISPPIKTTASDLWKEYTKNGAAADSKYAGRRVELSGVRGKVEKNSRGMYVIRALYASSPKTTSGPLFYNSVEQASQSVYQAAARANSIPSVVLYLDEKGLADFAGLDGKTPINIVGVCKGAQPDPSTDPEFFVAIESCRRTK